MVALTVPVKVCHSSKKRGVLRSINLFLRQQYKEELIVIPEPVILSAIYYYGLFLKLS